MSTGRRPAVRLAVAGVLLLAAAGSAGLSAAAMTGHVEGKDTTLTAGTLTLSTGHDGTSVLDGSYLRPGLSRSAIVALRNGGTVAATASLTLSDVADVPEAAGLSAVLELKVEDCGDDATCVAAPPRVAYDGSIKAFAGAVAIGALPADGTRFARVTLAWDASKADPARQGASTGATLTWTAVAGASA